MGDFPRAPFRSASSTAASVAAHVALLIILIAGTHRQPRIAPMRLPGTLTGTNLLPVYSPGGAAGADARTKPARRTPPPPQPRRKSLRSPAPPPPAPSPAASTGSGAAGQSSLGQDDINIALVRNHPSPAPDLSVLPHGAAGDVILDIVIDADGHIAGIKLDHGLDPTIDKSVIATVQQWSFAPATRNGQPIPSEQEILFHYVRS